MAKLTLIAGSANPRLAEAVARHLGIETAAVEIGRFPDGELHITIQQSIRGDDVFVMQSVSPPVDLHLIELLFIADACRRAGAGRITAVLPYLGYARQDRRASGREPISARLVADAIQLVGYQRIVTIDLHAPAVEGFFTVATEILSAVPLLAGAIQPLLPPDAVIIAPDLGAVKLADRYARRLGLPVAIVHKERLSGEMVTASRVTGDVRGRVPVIVDDMITTGATIEAAARTVLAAGAHPAIIIAVTHPLLVGPAAARLDGLPVRRLVVTDSVPLPSDFHGPADVVSLAPLLAAAIKRLHDQRSLADLRGYR